MKDNQVESKFIINTKQGIIFPIIDWIITNFSYLNLVEFFKLICKLIAKKNVKKRIQLSRVSVDIFILLKWLFITFLIIFNINKRWTTIFTWYLIISNIYTYFYYHTWDKRIIEDCFLETKRIKRRFLNLILAISYTLYSFAYLYYLPYYNEFSWTSTKQNFLKAFWYSVSTSFTGSYDQVKPINDLGYSISMIQLILMFIFLSIIIGGSIPQINSIINKKKE